MNIGIISFVDGRRRLGELDAEGALGFQKKTTSWLREQNYSVFAYQHAIIDFHDLMSSLEYLRAHSCDVIIFNICVWTFPDLPVQAARALQRTILLLGNRDPGYPGWVAYFAVVGALEECGIPFGKVLGNIEEADVQTQIRRFLGRSSPAQVERGNKCARKLRR